MKLPTDKYLLKRTFTGQDSTIMELLDKKTNLHTELAQLQQEIEIELVKACEESRASSENWYYAKYPQPGAKQPRAFAKIPKGFKQMPFGPANPFGEFAINKKGDEICLVDFNRGPDPDSEEKPPKSESLPRLEEGLPRNQS